MLVAGLTQSAPDEVFECITEVIGSLYLNQDSLKKLVNRMPSTETRSLMNVRVAGRGI
jgi:hypothetical protein